MNAYLTASGNAIEAKQLPHDQLLSLLERIPNRGYLLEQSRGSSFDIPYLQHLRGMMFFGCTFARFSSGEKSFFLHYAGRLIHAYHRGNRGVDAVSSFLDDASHSTVWTFRVLPPLMILGIAPIAGKIRATNLHSSALHTERLLQALEASGFSGTIALDYADQTHVWYVREGKLFQSQPMPPAFRGGTLYLFDAPSEPEVDLLFELELPKPPPVQEPQVQLLSPADQIWQIAKTVLDEYLGPSATMALERMKKDIKAGSLPEMKAMVNKRLEGVLGRAAAQKFASLAKEL